MNEQMLKEVMEDVLKELQDANKALAALLASVNQLQTTVGSFGQRLKDQQVIVQPPDLAPMQSALSTNISAGLEGIKNTLNEGVSSLTAVVAAQPKPIIRQWRFCLFPDNDHAGHYKLFLNRAFWVMVIAMWCTVLAFLGRQYIAQMPPAQRTPMSLEEVMQERQPTSEAGTPGRKEKHNGPAPMRPRIHGLTSGEARRQVDSMNRREKLRKTLDSVDDTLRQMVPDNQQK